MAKKIKKTPTTTGQYDKVFKENAEEIYESLIKSLFAIDTSKAENIEQSDLQYTIERKADFLKKILPTDNTPAYALHIEIQSDNDTEMNWRMLVYRSLVGKKYNLRTAQFVVYIGNDALAMASHITEEKLEFLYEIIDIRRYGYEEFLHASSPEEVILAILGNFHGEEPQTVIEKILQRLQQLAKTQLAVGKYTMQLEVISELRKLRQETKTQIHNMPVVFDYTKTTAYEKGEAKAKKDHTFGMLDEGLKPEAITRITKLPLETIQVWQKEWENERTKSV